MGITGLNVDLRQQTGVFHQSDTAYGSRRFDCQYQSRSLPSTRPGHEDPESQLGRRRSVGFAPGVSSTFAIPSGISDGNRSAIFDDRHRRRRRHPGEADVVRSSVFPVGTGSNDTQEPCPDKHSTM